MISVTEKAAFKIKEQLQKRGKGIGIRVGVRTTGCSGLAYKLEYVDAPDSNDINFVNYETQIFVDPKSLPYLTGTEIDWVRNGLNEGFDFKNPNVKDQCGCGESFRI